MLRISTLKFMAYMVILILSVSHLSATADTVQARIVNGKDASITDVPWQVALTKFNDDLYGSQYCGGSIIHAKWILTAAHCLEGLSALDAGFVVVGITDLSAPSNSTEVISIKQLVIHGDYDTDSFDNDIALLELSREIDFNVCDNACKIIDVLQAADQANVMPVSTPVKISGWGSFAQVPSSTTFPHLLQSVEINILDCNNTIRPNSQYSENMFCAGDYAAGADSCAGDSGGPLVAANNLGTGLVLAGITSWGPDICATDNDPGVYTRVANYGCFIQKFSNKDVDLGLDCGAMSKTSSGSTSWWLLSLLLVMRFFPKMRRLRY